VASQPRTFALFAPELKALLAKRALKELRQALALLSPMDLAEGWPMLSPEEQRLIFKLLSRRRAIVLFEALEIEDQARLLEALERERAAEAALPPSSAPDGGGPIPNGETAVGQLIRGLSPRTLAKLNRYLDRESPAAALPRPAYPEGTVGRLMHPPMVPLEAGLTARQALQRFHAALRPGSSMPVSMLFVTSRDGRLLRTVELRDLLAAPPDMTLADLSTSAEPIKLSPDTDQEDAARLFERYELPAAPVVDDAGRLIGILTLDDIVHVLKTEASEDIAKLGGTSPEELRSRSVLEIARLRMPWLVITVAGGLSVSLVIRLFEETLRELVALATFTPLIAGMGGNVGTQSSTIVVRGLATGEIPEGTMLSTAWRETRTGLMLGALYGILAAGVAAALYGSALPPRFPLVVGIAMCVSMTTAATLGAAVPFCLKRAGTDPANATGPFITTTTDLLTNALYLGLATWWLAAR
jgi:magnesium transporter